MSVAKKLWNCTVSFDTFGGRGGGLIVHYATLMRALCKSLHQHKLASGRWKRIFVPGRGGDIASTGSAFQACDFEEVYIISFLSLSLTEYQLRKPTPDCCYVTNRAYTFKLVQALLARDEGKVLHQVA